MSWSKLWVRVRCRDRKTALLITVLPTALAVTFSFRAL